MSSRNQCFTLNNYTEDEYKNICELDCNYLVVGKEMGEQKTPHLQGYIEFKSSKRLTTLKKINPRIHWENRKGTAKQAAEYCKKENNFYEKGKISNQGERSDLNEVKNDIFNGKKVDEIIIENPKLYHQYGRTLNKIEDLAMRRKYRTEMTEGIWIYGPTGTGKSHKAFENFNPETHYVWPNDGDWWDGYQQQETVIINDFRGEIPYNQLLQLVDKWPYAVRRRGREPMQFNSKRVIITSSLSPEETYNRRNAEDDIAQLKRRFKIAAEVVGGNTNAPTIKKREDNC